MLCIEQLKAAKSTGHRVYLAVSDVIGESMDLLKDQLERRQLANIVVVTFPETKLKAVSSTLRKGLGLVSGVALVTADQIDQIAEEKSDDQDIP